MLTLKNLISKDNSCVVNTFEKCCKKQLYWKKTSKQLRSIIKEHILKSVENYITSNPEKNNTRLKRYSFAVHSINCPNSANIMIRLNLGFLENVLTCLT